MKKHRLPEEEKLLKILTEELVGDKEVYAAMIARKNLEEIRPLRADLKPNSELMQLWETLKHSMNQVFDFIPAYIELGVDSINLRLGNFNVLYYIMPPFDIMLVAVTPLTANLERVEKKMDAARRRIIFLLETERGKKPAKEDKQKVNPKDAESYRCFGLVYGKQGKFDEAIMEFKKALKINPLYVPAYCDLGLVYYKQGKFDDAIAEWKKALEIDPKDVQTRCNLGLLYGEQSRFDEAAVELEKALKLTPKHADIYCNLGSIYRKQCRLKEAETVLKKSLKICPKYADAHNNLGTVYADQCRLKEAEAEYKKALTINPKHEKALRNLKILQKKDDPKEEQHG